MADKGQPFTDVRDAIVLDNLRRLRRISHLRSQPDAVAKRGPSASEGLLTLRYIRQRLNIVSWPEVWTRARVEGLFGERKGRHPRYYWSDVVKLAYAFEVTVFDLVVDTEVLASGPEDDEEITPAVEIYERLFGLPRQVFRDMRHEARVAVALDQIWRRAVECHPALDAVEARIEESFDRDGRFSERRWREALSWGIETADRIRTRHDPRNSQTAMRLAKERASDPGLFAEIFGAFNAAVEPPTTNFYRVSVEDGLAILREAGALDESGHGDGHG